LLGSPSDSCVPTPVILAHREQANDMGLIGEWLDTNGWECSRIWREDASEWPEADLMIVLGSLSSVASG